MRFFFACSKVGRTVQHEWPQKEKACVVRSNLRGRTDPLKQVRLPLLLVLILVGSYTCSTSNVHIAPQGCWTFSGFAVDGPPSMALWPDIRCFCYELTTVLLCSSLIHWAPQVYAVRPLSVILRQPERFSLGYPHRCWTSCFDC